MRRRFLNTSRVDVVYLRRLKTCRQHLARWEQGRAVVVADLLRRPRALDGLLVEYVHNAYCTSTPLYIPKHAVLAIEFASPELKRRLPRTWQALKGWELKSQWRPRPPITEEVMWHVFLAAFEFGTPIRWAPALFAPFGRAPYEAHVLWATAFR